LCPEATSLSPLRQLPVNPGRAIIMNNHYESYKIASAYQDQISRDADNFRKFQEVNPTGTPNILRIISISPVMALLIFMLISFFNKQ